MTPISSSTESRNHSTSPLAETAQSSAPFSSLINPLDSTEHPPLDGRAEFRRQLENSLLCAIITRIFEWIFQTFLAPTPARTIEFHELTGCQSLEQARKKSCEILGIDETTQHLWNTEVTLHPKTNAPFSYTFENQETLEKFEVRYQGHPSVQAYILAPIQD